MKRWLLAEIILLLLASCLSAQTQIGAAGGSSSPSSTISATTNAIYAANGFGLTSGKIVQDGVWTNGSQTITSATAAFTSAMNGWSIFGQAGQCALGSAQEMNGALQLPLGTLTFVNATTVTTSVSGASITTVASNGCLIFGPVMDTALSAIDTAWQTSIPCGPLIFPAGVFLYSNAHFITQPTACRPLGTDTSVYGQGAQFMGQGTGNTTFVPLDNFVWAGCVGGSSGHACMGGFQSAYFHDFSIFGNNSRLGKTATGSPNLFECNAYSLNRNLFFADFGGADTGIPSGFNSANGVGTGCVIDNVTVDAFGGNGNANVNVATTNSILATHLHILDCIKNCLLTGTSSTTWCEKCAFEGGPSSVSGYQLVINNGIYYGLQDFCVENGASLNGSCFSNNFGATLYAVQEKLQLSVANTSNGINNSGTIFAQQSIFQGGAGGSAINQGATGIFIDNGGNSVPGGAISNAAGARFSVIATISNCAVNSASPAACGSASNGVFVVPTLTTTYTVNTTAVTANSRIFLQPISDNTGIPSAPTCATLAVTAVSMVSSRVAGTSFTFTLPSTTGTTCFYYSIIN